MKILIWILKIYLWIFFAWVLMSWIHFIPGVATLCNLIGVIVEPVVRPFSFLSFGGLGFGAIVPAFLLYWLIGWLENNYATSTNVHPEFKDEYQKTDSGDSRSEG